MFSNLSYRVCYVRSIQFSKRPLFATFYKYHAFVINIGDVCILWPTSLNSKWSQNAFWSVIIRLQVIVTIEMTAKWLWIWPLGSDACPSHLKNDQRAYNEYDVLLLTKTNHNELKMNNKAENKLNKSFQKPLFDITNG